MIHLLLLEQLPIKYPAYNVIDREKKTATKKYFKTHLVCFKYFLNMLFKAIFNNTKSII